MVSIDERLVGFSRPPARKNPPKGGAVARTRGGARPWAAAGGGRGLAVAVELGRGRRPTGDEGLELANQLVGAGAREGQHLQRGLALRRVAGEQPPAKRLDHGTG